MKRAVSESVVVVTGASSGIGRATARAFAERGRAFPESLQEALRLEKRTVPRLLQSELLSPPGGEHIAEQGCTEPAAWASRRCAQANRPARFKYAAVQQPGPCGFPLTEP